MDVRWVNRKWDLTVPSFVDAGIGLNTYEVQRDEDMRIDLVMKSIYNDESLFGDIDVILFINGIDNPLNIREGMVIYYPPEPNSLDNYRYYEEENIAITKSIKQQLGVLNKTTRIDEKRKKFLDSDYSLPPVVMPESRAGVSITDTTIKVGGL